MVELEPTFLMAAVPAVLIAAISKAGFGSGASFVSVTILALVLPPALALGLMLPILIVIDLASLRPYWNRWDRKASWLLAGFALPGIGLGALFIGLADPSALKGLIGVISLAFVAYQLWPKPTGGGSSLPGWAGALAGAVAGFTSFVSHAGGPITAIYLLRQGLGKTTYQATTVIVFFAINLMKLGFYIGMGLIGVESMGTVVMLAPVALIGTWIGVRAHIWMPERAFFTLTYALLVATGLKLIFDSVV